MLIMLFKRLDRRSLVEHTSWCGTGCFGMETTDSITIAMDLSAPSTSSSASMSPLYLALMLESEST